MKLLFSLRILRVVLALTVALWMGGAGCMFGCENMTTAAASSETRTLSLSIVASGDACSAMQSHDCCARHGKKSAAKTEADTSSDAALGPPQFSGTSQTIIDCPLAANAVVALAKSSFEQTSVALSVTGAKNSFSESPEPARSSARSLRLPNRGHTYLCCCVFLI
jgi:hypothetical protein